MLIHFTRRKRDSGKNLLFIVNIGGLKVEVKKSKAKNVRGISKPKNNIKEIYISGGKEE